MIRRIIHKVALLTTALLLISAFAVGASALEWDGASQEGGGYGTDAGTVGYALRTLDDNVIGYRFSLVDASGSNKVSKVIDIFRDYWLGDNGYAALYKFVPKYNKCQLITNQDGSYSTVFNTTNCYKEANLGLATTLPAPADIETWQNNASNVNKVLELLGAGSIDDLVLGDKLIIEPIYDVRLESVWHAVTLTEIAVYGRHMFGGSSIGGATGNPETFGFIATYTNRYYCNELYTPDGQGLWEAATPVSQRITFDTIISKGYGVGIAYTQKTGTAEPILAVDLCEAWADDFGYYEDMYGHSTGASFNNWELDCDYPIMGDDIWFDIRFPQETENYHVRQTVTVDDGDPVNRVLWSNQGMWYNVAPADMTISADKEYYTVVARVDWIDEDGNVLKYGAEKTFYIPVQPKVNRYQVVAYNCLGVVQASNGIEITSGTVYYGQKVRVSYQYTCDNTWTSNNNLYGTMYKWNDDDWVPSLSTPDGQDLNEAMINGTTDTVTSSLGYLRITDSYDSGENQIPFYLSTAWAIDPNNTTQSDWYSIPIVTPDVELYEIYLVDEDGYRLDHTDLTLGETVYVRHKYRNYTNCTLIVDGYNNDREEISVSGVYRIPANSTIVVAAGSFVVTEDEFTLWGGVYLEGAGIYNTEYESDGTNNESTLTCTVSYPLELIPVTPNANYREGTSVITSYWLLNNGSKNITPDNDITIRMRVCKPDGTPITSQTTTQVIVPGNNQNLYYFKWSVPEGLNGNKVVILADIIDGESIYSRSINHYTTCICPEYDTPDTDYETQAPDGFAVPSTPTATGNYATWWQWVWENDGFVKKYYGIGIPYNSAESLTPDSHSNSSYSDGGWTMKSGYGVWLKALNQVSSVSGYNFPDASAYTSPQFAYATFPEFSYAYGPDVCKTLAKYSNYWFFSDPANMAYHYTPIYFPDGQYVVKIVKSDMWTPSGMIVAVSTSNPITIQDSAYDDWFVGRE